MKTKVWSIVLTICMLFSMVPMNVSAEGADTPDLNTIIEVDSIVLDKTELTLEVEATDVLTVLVGPENASDKTVTWSSSDEAVVTVDGNGYVTAVAEGTAEITAKAGEIEARCAVTVVAKTKEIEKIELTINGLPENGESFSNDVKNIVVTDNVITIENAQWYEFTNLAPASIDFSAYPEATIAESGKVYALAIKFGTNGNRVSDNVELMANGNEYDLVLDADDTLVYYYMVGTDKIEISDVDVPEVGMEPDFDITLTPECDSYDVAWGMLSADNNLMPAGTFFEKGEIYCFYTEFPAKLNEGAKIYFDGNPVKIYSGNGYSSAIEYLINANDAGKNDSFVAIYDDYYVEFYALYKTLDIKRQSELNVKIDRPQAYMTPDTVAEGKGVEGVVWYEAGIDDYDSEHKQYYLNLMSYEEDSETGEIFYYEPFEPENPMTGSYGIYACVIAASAYLTEDAAITINGTKIEKFVDLSSDNIEKILYEESLGGEKDAFVAAYDDESGKLIIFAVFEKLPEDTSSTLELENVYPAVKDNPESEWNNDTTITVEWVDDTENSRPSTIELRIYRREESQNPEVPGEYLKDLLKYGEMKLSCEKGEESWKCYFTEISLPCALLSLDQEQLEVGLYFSFETPEGYTSSVEGNTITFTAIPAPKPEKTEKPKKTEVQEVVEEPELVEVVMVQTVPPTSDNNNIYAWNTLLVASALGLVVAFMNGKKRRTE